MYSFLRGVVENASPTEVDLDVGGVGYRLLIPLSTYSWLPSNDAEVKLRCEMTIAGIQRK